LSNAKRRLASLMDQTFPEFATQFADPCGRAAFAVLKEAPNARRISQLHLKRLTHLLCHGSNNQMGSSRAVKLRTAARQSIAVNHDDEALNCSVLLIVAQIEFLQEQIAQLGRQIGRAFDALDHPIKTIPGIGRVTAPVILSELGCISRFAGPRGAHRMLAYAGLDPCVRESGMWKGRIKMSKRGSPVLRTALFQAASMGRLHHPFFAAIYDRQRHQKQKHHHIAISHVARKLVEIIYAVCKSNQPFDPSKLCPSTS
jgi:transposase